MKYLGIDWGEARIGLAIGDSETKIASPLSVAANIDELLLVIKEEEIDIAVVGKPYQISNAQYPVNEKFSEFLKLLASKVKLRIELVDERLSSKAADALVGNKKTKAPRDAIAAMLILQTYLDEQENNERLRK